MFWIPDSKTYQRSKFQPKTMSYEGDMIFQRWQLNSISKQVSWRNESKLRSEASKPISKFLFQQFSSSKKSKIMHSSFFLLVVNKHARLNSFAWLQGHANLQISRTVRFIFPFLFSLYDEYVCSSMIIFSMIVYFNC